MNPRARRRSSVCSGRRGVFRRIGHDPARLADLAAASLPKYVSVVIKSTRSAAAPDRGALLIINTLIRWCSLLLTLPVAVHARLFIFVINGPLLAVGSFVQGFT